MSDEETILTNSDNEEPEVPAGEGEKKSPGRPKSVKGPKVPSGKPRGRPKKEVLDSEQDGEGVKKSRGRPKGPPKSPKAGKGGPKTAPTHAPFTKLVSSALAILQIEEKKGASKIAIVKHIMDEEPECSDKLKVAKSVGKALKRLMAQKVIVAPKGHTGKFKMVDQKSSASPKKKSKGRGRPKLEESPKKSIKGPSGKPRGRPKGATKTPKKTPEKRGKPKSVGGSTKKTASSGKKPAYVPSGKPRGRPKKVD